MTMAVPMVSVNLLCYGVEDYKVQMKRYKFCSHRLYLFSVIDVRYSGDSIHYSVFYFSFLRPPLVARRYWRTIAYGKCLGNNLC